MYNILVTGCGGDIGQSIGKILKNHSMIAKVMGADVHKKHAGKYIFDDLGLLPYCSQKEYILELNTLIEKWDIHFVIPVSEPELRFYSNNGHLEEKIKVPLIKANKRSLEVGFDKLKTAQFLELADMPFPRTVLIDNWEDFLYPAIAKSRSGSGSKNVFAVKSEKEAKIIASIFPEFILQEMVGEADMEFTCGLFRSNEGVVRSIIFRRELMGGFSGYGERVENQLIDELLLEIAKKLDLRGSINVQLRLTKKGPIVFEINPRFSSTVLFRDLMGFSDVIWSIEDLVSSEISDFKLSNSSNIFYKGFNEYVE